MINKTRPSSKNIHGNIQEVLKSHPLMFNQNLLAESKILKERQNVHRSNFVILKILKVPSEKVHDNIQRILKGGLK